MATQLLISIHGSLLRSLPSHQANLQPSTFRGFQSKTFYLLCLLHHPSKADGTDFFHRKHSIVPLHPPHLLPLILQVWFVPLSPFWCCCLSKIAVTLHWWTAILGILYLFFSLEHVALMIMLTPLLSNFEFHMKNKRCSWRKKKLRTKIYQEAEKKKRSYFHALQLKMILKLKYVLQCHSYSLLSSIIAILVSPLSTPGFKLLPTFLTLTLKPEGLIPY